MNPKPIGRVAADGEFERPVYIAHDAFRSPGVTIFARGDFVARFNTPLSEADAITDAGM